MKFTYLIPLVFLLFSCSVENQDTPQSSDTLTSKRTDAPPQELEKKMQWASFLAALVLELDPLARDEFTSLALTPNNAISIKNILKVNSIAPNFKTRFLEVLNSYSVYLCQSGKPEIGVVPPSAIPDSVCVALYLDYISVENCLQFYFPKGLILDPVLPISSTAHPLSLNNENYGYKRYEKFPGKTLVKEDIINSSYLELNKDIIVTRPVSGGLCDYSGWGIDFTLFLAN